MTRVHSSRYTCWSGNHSLFAEKSFDDEDVNCKNCRKIMTKTENRLHDIESWVRQSTSTMSNKSLLETILDLHPDDYDEQWSEEGLFERSIYIECLSERLGEWMKQ